jgi:hypothetical protein
MIESGMVVDTTTPDSIIREAFQKCCVDKDLREAATLAFSSVMANRRHLPAFAPSSGTMPLGKAASSTCQ